MLKNQEFEAFFSDRNVSASEDTWHLRLGHSSSGVLQHLKSSNAIVVNKGRTSPLCESCQMGKSSRLKFFQFSSSVSQPLGRIHCDLWGPSPIVSYQGFRYYAVFVDDFSRFSWLYPLHNKGDFYSVFKSFKNLVENQFNAKIKEFQSDGGGEFIGQNMKQYLSENGIHNRISCPYTREQNGVAERKHIHFLELGLAHTLLGTRALHDVPRSPSSATLGRSILHG